MGQPGQPGQPGRSGPTPEQLAEAQAKREALRKARPTGITILGVIVLLVGLGNLILGLYYTSLFGIVLSENFWSGLGTLIFGIFLMIAGAGLLTLRMWAWWLAVIMVLINLGNAIYIMVSQNSYPIDRILIAAVLGILFIYLIVVRKGYMKGSQAVTASKA